MKNFTLSKGTFRHNQVESHYLLANPENIRTDRFGNTPVAIFTHGFTSNKQDLLNWMQKFASNQVPVLIFDLPGHYLGNLTDVESIHEFHQATDQFFQQAKTLLESTVQQSNLFYLVGGHSLGALLSLLVLDNVFPKTEQTLSLIVGLGSPKENEQHFFDTELFSETRKFRDQLVSPAINMKDLFAWSHDIKRTIQVKNRKIHLICGENDVVVGPEGVERLLEHLKSQNEVTLDKPKKLSHHEPQLAHVHLYSYLKRNYW
ncbi:alpha/beta fold hydrolase [Bacteriovoracaceae bacterium]|nr:alpha/beta fold hydrolase [Bacteriovoracaceae bacterium]